VTPPACGRNAAAGGAGFVAAGASGCGCAAGCVSPDGAGCAISVGVGVGFGLPGFGILGRPVGNCADAG